jgi:60 kDa SS-A/Ro ribonucleoprotein
MPLAKTTQIVCDRLHDEAYLQASRIHPFNVLLALSTYKKGMGVRGKLTWSPVTQIIGGLQDAFYASFKNVNPTGKRHMIALDVSGSMGWAIINNSHLSARGAAAAMAMVTARTEVRHMFTAFATTFKKLNITPNSSLDFIIDTVKRMRFGATDCAQPMLYAAKNKIPVDVFIIYTDNETWAGKPHPSQALQMYRDKMGINAKLVVVGMTSTKFSIADPTDPGMLDIVGFDSNCPSLISNFTAGDTAYV